MEKAKVRRSRSSAPRSSAVMNLEMVGAEEGDEVEAYDVALEAATKAGVADDHAVVQLCQGAPPPSAERHQGTGPRGSAGASSIEELEAALATATELALVEDEVRTPPTAWRSSRRTRRKGTRPRRPEQASVRFLAQVDEALAWAEEVVDMSGAAATACKAKQDALEAQAKARAAATASLIGRGAATPSIY